MTGLLPKVEGLEQRLKDAAARLHGEDHGGEPGWRLTWLDLGACIEVVNPYTGMRQGCDPHWLRELAGGLKRRCQWTGKEHTGIALWQLDLWGRSGQWREERTVGGQAVAYDPALEAPKGSAKTGAEMALGLPSLEKFVAIDVETTGISQDDRVIELALVAFKGGQVVHRWVRRFHPEGRDIHRGSQAVHGIRADELRHCGRFGQIAPWVRRYMERAGVVVAHNMSFDKRMLVQSGLEWPVGVEEICTVDLAKALKKVGVVTSRSVKLNVVCSEFGVPLKNHHAASDDAEACGRLLVALVDRWETGSRQRGLWEAAS